ncbi:MAG: LytS/YhcK type 5TM receptor domain-containing protein [Candidatus Sericytochromatia bacterium]|nr:LytS/YhcK type 5TM receptor domain-containing protein [Candidatus Sericytochromatia bacterium]
MTLLRALWLLLPLALVWESSELAVLPYFEWRLDPVLALVLLAGLMLGPRQGVWLGLVAGGCQDLLVGAGLLYGGTKALAGLLAGLVQPHIYRLDALSLATVGILASLGEGLLIALFLFAQGRTAVWDHFASMSLPLGLVNAALLVLLYVVVGRLPAPELREG